MEEPLHSCWNLLISPPINRTCDGLGKVRLVGHFLKKHAQNSSKGPACKSLQQLQKNHPLMQKIKKQAKHRQHTNTFTRFVGCERGSCLPPQKNRLEQVVEGFYNGISTAEVDTLAAETCAYMYLDLSWDVWMDLMNSWSEFYGTSTGNPILNSEPHKLPKWLSQQKNSVGWFCNDFDIYIYTFIWHKRWYKQLL